MPTIEQLALECWLGWADAAAIAAWCATLDPSDPAAELRTLNAGARVEAFSKIAQVRCGYPPCAAEASRAASAVLKGLCSLALELRIRLVDLATALQRLESVFVLDNQDPTVPIPEYLDELYELFDWCDASWRLENNRTLEAELRRVRDAIDAGAG